jgi:hypothetical protein
MNNVHALQQALAPKSDQLNADDLIAANKIIVISGVNINLGSEQKIIINYYGDNGKPWKPSKGMGRVLTELLGGDPDKWVGETVELFRNKEIRFGKEKCGGIQIAGMSAVRNVTTLLITTSKGKKSSITINPIAALGNAPAQQRTQAPAAQPAQQNPKRELAVKLKAAVNYGSLAVDEVWAMVPVELRADMDSFYKEQFIKSQAFDPVEQEPIPAHVSEELPPSSLDDF